MTFIEKVKVSPFRADVEYTCQCGRENTHKFQNEDFELNQSDEGGSGKKDMYTADVDFSCEYCRKPIRIVADCEEYPPGHFNYGNVDEFDGCTPTELKVYFTDSEGREGAPDVIPLPCR